MKFSVFIFVVLIVGTSYGLQEDSTKPLPTSVPEEVTPTATPTPTPTQKPRSARELVKELASPNPYVHAAAVKQLEEMREQAIPELIQTLSSRSPRARALSASVLWKLGVSANSAIPKLKSMMKKDGDEGVRLRAAQALGRIDVHPGYVVPELVKCLKGCSNWGRAEAASILGELGPTALPALPVLKKALNDPQKEVRISAEKAIQNIDVKKNTK